jgi:hypothetical protein
MVSLLSANVMNCFRPLLIAALLAGSAGQTAAQLRPLDPVDFAAFRGDAIHARAGVALYADQHASLGGTVGTLKELGTFQVTIRTGRMVMDMGGGVRRLFTDHDTIDAPFAEVRPQPNGKRTDDGDYRVGTLIRLTPARSRTLAVLRFGTRLPTTDNRVGLERDITDFFATVGAQRVFGKVALGAEAGVSINGTRDPTYEQSDVLVYSLSAETTLRSVTPFAVIVGQQDFHDWATRGNEDLSELRAGIRAGRRRWITATWVHGLTDYSPSNGVQLSAGMMFGLRLPE